MRAALIAETFACCLLVLMGLGFSWAALLMTGGDSAFQNESSWVYAPLLVALVLTATAIVATARRLVPRSAALIGASVVAYAATLMYWAAVAD